jgi:hypothetical protein
MVFLPLRKKLVLDWMFTLFAAAAINKLLTKEAGLSKLAVRSYHEGSQKVIPTKGG